MKADEIRKISDHFNKEPFVHQRNTIDPSEEYESRYTTEEICSVCGLSRLEIDWQAEKGMEDKWCKVALHANTVNASFSETEKLFAKANRHKGEKLTWYAHIAHFFVSTQRLLGKLRFLL